MSNSASPEDGLSVEPVVEITVSATEGVDPCQLFSDALDESCLQLDQLLPRIKRQAEDLYRCRRSMSLSEAANSGDHPDALVLETTLVELAAYGGRLPDLIKQINTTEV